MSRKPVLVQLDDDLVARLDAVARRRSVSRSELLRSAAEALLTAEARLAAERALIAGYRAGPQGEDEVAVATLATRALVAEEPW